MITFDIQSFKKDEISLLKFLYSLKYKGLFVRTNEIDVFFSQKPSLAYKYIRDIVVEKSWLTDEAVRRRVYLNVDKNRLDTDQEKVFTKNIKFGIAYLEVTQQKKFRDEKLQENFEKKVYKDAGASFDYSTKILCERIPEDKEHVFLEDYFIMYQYAMRVIKGKFQDKIHKQIYLKTFENKQTIWAGARYAQDYLKHYLNQDDGFVDNRYSYYRY